MHLCRYIYLNLMSIHDPQIFSPPLDVKMCHSNGFFSSHVLSKNTYSFLMNNSLSPTNDIVRNFILLFQNVYMNSLFMSTSQELESESFGDGMLIKQKAFN